MSTHHQKSTQPNSHADYRIVSDGGSKGNGTPTAEAYASYQLASRTGDEALFRLELATGTTNNQAEYEALSAGLNDLLCRIRNTKHRTSDFTVKAYTDSKLIVNQLNGTYKVRSPNLQPLHEHTSALIRQFKSVHVIHTPRSNIHAVLGH